MTDIGGLKYDKSMMVTDRVEATILDIRRDATSEKIDVDGVAVAYLWFIERADNDEKYQNCWRDCEITRVCTIEEYQINIGIKFVFTRVLTGKNSKDSPAMGGGTQWVSDVIDLMKSFLGYLRQLDVQSDTTHFFDARLRFRIDGKQIEWR